MELRLQMLDNFRAEGSDGTTYKVIAYDRLVPVPGGVDQWEPSGQVEYRLADGRLVDETAAGKLEIAGSAITLTPLVREHADR